MGVKWLLATRGPAHKKTVAIFGDRGFQISPFVVSFKFLESRSAASVFEVENYLWGDVGFESFLRSSSTTTVAAKLQTVVLTSVYFTPSDPCLAPKSTDIQKSKHIASRVNSLAPTCIRALPFWLFDKSFPKSH